MFVLALRVQNIIGFVLSPFLDNGFKCTPAFAMPVKSCQRELRFNKYFVALRIFLYARITLM